jgi:hypothetical protein
MWRTLFSAKVHDKNYSIKHYASCPYQCKTLWRTVSVLDFDTLEKKRDNLDDYRHLKSSYLVWSRHTSMTCWLTLVNIPQWRRLNRSIHNQSVSLFWKKYNHHLTFVHNVILKEMYIVECIYSVDHSAVQSNIETKEKTFVFLFLFLFVYTEHFSLH